MIPIAKPLIGREEHAAVAAVLASGQLAHGPRVAEFERCFAEFVGVKHAVATSSGTAALHVALLAHGVGPGDEVITTPFTFVATASAIVATGARPVFVDIDECFNLDPALVEAAITPRTRAVLPVHLFGQPADLAALAEIARRHRLALIEDACQAHGAAFDRRLVGSFGCGCFSYYATKNMTTGEGGCLTTDDDELADAARLIINHGMRARYDYEGFGLNFRMTELAAAIGLIQLRKLPAFNARRAENAAFYSQRLSAIGGLRLPTVAPRRRHIWHQYTLRVGPAFPLSRADLAAALDRAGIGSGIYYPRPLHLHSDLASDAGRPLRLPVAEQPAREVISIPVHPGVADRDRQYIAATLERLSGGA